MRNFLIAAPLALAATSVLFATPVSAGRHDGEQPRSEAAQTATEITATAA